MSAPIRRAGIDVGGTKLLGVVLNEDGAIIAEHRVPTPREGPEAMVADLVELARSLGDWRSIGIGMPGIVDRSGVLRAAPNLIGMDGVPIGHLVSEALGVRVEVDNDATCATVAEWQLGAARGCRDVLLATLGTGIGGGLVSNGALQRGANGFAGEIGHMVVDPAGPPCPCGRRGCWERYASGSALAARAREELIQGRLRAVAEAGVEPDEVRGEHVQIAAASGDPDALRVIDDFARWIALGLANLTNIVDPVTIVLGGGLASAPAVYLPPVSRWFADLLYAGDRRPLPRLAFAELGEHAGAIGAALLPAARVHDR